MLPVRYQHLYHINISITAYHKDTIGSTDSPLCPNSPDSLSLSQKTDKVKLTIRYGPSAKCYHAGPMPLEGPHGLQWTKSTDNKLLLHLGTPESTLFGSKENLRKIEIFQC